MTIRMSMSSAVLFFAAVALAQQSSSQSAQDKLAIRAFQAMLPVLSHPRCANCHPSGDQPLQSDDGHVHPMNIRRAEDGKGTVAMRCTNCHQDANASALHAPPGVPDWHMPPSKTPMGWQGLSSAELCRALKDPTKNGNRPAADLIEHMNTDLVKWAWQPGPGRSVPPLTHAEFVAKVTEWVHNGAACAP